MRAQRMTDRLGYHCEGPVWWARRGALRFVDMLHGTIITLDDGEPVRRSVGSPIAAVVRPIRGGGAVIAREHDVVTCDEELEHPVPLATVDSRVGMRCNEGGCSPAGDFFIGTMAYEQTEAAAGLYRIRAGSDRAEIVTSGLTVANGLDWSPDGRLAYHVDSPRRTVDIYDVDSDGELVERRPFLELPDVDGVPDGLTVAADGSVWFAVNGAGLVLGCDFEGQIIERITVGARQVTACTFGGEGLDRLFITTSRENLSDEDDPAAGSIFVAEPGAIGRPALEFAG